jgi:uridylate kinase
MDITAFSLCQQNKLPIIVFDLQDTDSIIRVIEGEDIGTSVTSEEKE